MSQNQKNIIKNLQKLIFILYHNTHHSLLLNRISHMDLFHLLSLILYFLIYMFFLITFILSNKNHRLKNNLLLSMDFLM